MKVNKNCNNNFCYIAVLLKISNGFFIKQSKEIKLCTTCMHHDDWITESRILNDPNKLCIKYELLHENLLLIKVFLYS